MSPDLSIRHPQHLPKIFSVVYSCGLAITVTGSFRTLTGFPFHRSFLRTYFLWLNCQLYEHCILFSHLLLLLSIQRYSLMDIFAFHFVISILVTAASRRKDSVLPTLLAVPPAVSHIQRESVVPLRTRNIPDIPGIPFPCLDNRH